MSSQERKKKKTHSIYSFTNLNGALLTLEVYSCANVSRFIIKKVAHEHDLARVLCFLLLLLFYGAIVYLNIFDGWYCSPILVFGLIGLLGTIRKVVEESFLIVENLGLQIDIKYVIGGKSKFIPNDIVKDLFINEVIFRHRVIYLLSILTKDEHTILPLFQETLPRLDCLQIIYRSFKSAKCIK